MVYIQDHCISLIAKEQGKYTLKQGMAKSFYHQHVYVALQKAQEYGEVLTMPELLQAKAFASFDDLLWKVPFIAESEEIIGLSMAGTAVSITVHGRGLLTPERIKEEIIFGLTKTESGRSQHAVGLKAEEVHALLDGKTPSGEIAVYSYEDFMKNSSLLPRKYAVVRDFELRKEIPAVEQSLTTLAVLPLLRTYAGGEENLALYLGALGEYYQTARAVYSHNFHSVDVTIAQGRLLQTQGIVQMLGGCLDMSAPARFLAMRREDLEEKIDKEVTIEVG